MQNYQQIRRNYKSKSEFAVTQNKNLNYFFSRYEDENSWFDFNRFYASLKSNNLKNKKNDVDSSFSISDATLELRKPNLKNKALLKLRKKTESLPVLRSSVHLAKHISDSSKVAKNVRISNHVSRYSITPDQGAEETGK